MGLQRARNSRRRNGGRHLVLPVIPGVGARRVGVRAAVGAGAVAMAGLLTLLRTLPAAEQAALWAEGQALTQEEAIAYAEREGLPYRVEEPQEPKRRDMSYSDNFKFNRVGPWTH